MSITEQDLWQMVMARYPKLENERKCALERNLRNAARQSYFEKLKQQNKTNNMDQTVGQKRVRVSFNPSADNVVDTIKQKAADLIDLCEDFKQKDARLASLAQTSFEEAAMWAVKAATA